MSLYYKRRDGIWERGKLNPRYIVPYEIFEHIERVSYRLALCPEMSLIHPVFHVSMLRNCISIFSYVRELLILQLDENLMYK